MRNFCQSHEATELYFLVLFSGIAPISAPAGTIMPWGGWVISFCEHPKAIELKTGTVVHVWEDLDSGRQIGAIDLGKPPLPRIALNPGKGMFAVRHDDKIHIVTPDQSL